MDGMIDPICEPPRSPEATTAVLPPLVPPPGVLRKLANGLPGRSLLVALVMVLGLLHGSRTALGSGTPPSAVALPEVSSPPARETDWRRGHFYRPAGSTAERPEVSLRPRVWRPEPRVALACLAQVRPSGC
jgi:hypothetical protein